MVETFDIVCVPPSVKQTPGASDGEGGYTLQGVVNPNNQAITDCKFKWGPNSNELVFGADCSPMPVGRNEVQQVAINATTGQFRLSYRGQTTPDIAVGATASVVEAELEALTLLGPNVAVAGGPDPAHPYLITFDGSLAEKNVSQIQAQGFGLGGQGSQTGLGVSTKVEGGTASRPRLKPISPASPPTPPITPSSSSTTAPASMKTAELLKNSNPPSPPKMPCANDQLRVENNSLALPECRAYEMVSPPSKEGFGVAFDTYDGGDRVVYDSEVPNIAGSGEGSNGANHYLATRSDAGWETIPNLNGSSGSLRDAPSYVDSNVFNTLLLAYSSDLRSSIWRLHRQGDPGTTLDAFPFRRGPDGTFTPLESPLQVQYGAGSLGALEVSADLSHVVNRNAPFVWGPGIYEFIGTGMDQPRRVDLDNSGAPISTCTSGPFGRTAANRFVSSDGSRIINHVYGGCGGANPPADELWARVNDTTAVDVSASHCDRSAADPGGVCNGPVGGGGCSLTNSARKSVPVVAGFASRVPPPTAPASSSPPNSSWSDADTDQTNDIYACDIPAGNPAPNAEKANPCSAFRQISAGDPRPAPMSRASTSISEDGSTVLFTAKGMLADNDDALGEEAVAGDHNLYVWRATDANPDGQTRFVARLEFQ